VIPGISESDVRSPAISLPSPEKLGGTGKASRRFHERDRKVLRSAMAAFLLLGTKLAFADPSIGDRWTVFRMLDTRGRSAEWRPGRVTVFSFCAYWCDTWKTQVPRLVEAQGALKGLPVDIVTISTDGRWSEVAANNGGLTLWRDAGGDWSHKAGVDRVPTTVVLDPSGKVVFSRGGIVRRDDLIPAVQKALAGTTADGGSIYLTFDDFPPPSGGEDLLDVLRSSGVKATFFCLGSRVESSSKLLLRAIREGHSVQCHSWDHKASDPQLNRCHEVFKRVLRQDFGLYRAPGSEKIVGLEVQPPVTDPYDFTRPKASELLRRINSSVHSGSEIQLHAGVQVTLDALPEIVRRLRGRGFDFATLGH